MKKYLSKLSGYSFHIFVVCLLTVSFFFIPPVVAENVDEPGLLFYLSGENGFTADYACGDPNPNWLNGIEIIPRRCRRYRHNLRWGLREYSMMLTPVFPNNQFFPR